MTSSPENNEFAFHPDITLAEFAQRPVVADAILTEEQIDLLIAFRMRRPTEFPGELDIERDLCSFPSRDHWHIAIRAADAVTRTGPLELSFASFNAELNSLIQQAGINPANQVDLTRLNRLCQVLNSELPSREIVSQIYRRVLGQKLWNNFKRLATDPGHRGVTPTVEYLLAVNSAISREADHIAAVTSANVNTWIRHSDFMAEADSAIDWHVAGVLAKGEPCVVGGPMKACKTGAMLDLALSLALPAEAEARFLGHYPVRPCPVTVVSAESGKVAIRKRYREILVGKGLPGDSALNLTWRFKPLRLSMAIDLRELSRELRDRPGGIVILDPLYLMLLSGSSEISASNMYEMGPLLERVAGVCLDAGATPVLVHHFSKQNSFQSGDPPELMNLAFAGIGEFAAQWMLFSRRKPYDPERGRHELWLALGGRQGHSALWGLDVDERFTGGPNRLAARPSDNFTWHVRLTRQSEILQATRDLRAQQQREEVRSRTMEAASRIEAELRSGPFTKSELRDRLGIGAEKVGRGIEALLADARIRPIEVLRGNRSGRPCTGYEIAVPSPSQQPSPVTPEHSSDTCPIR